MNWIPIDPDTPMTDPPWDGKSVLISTNHRCGDRVHKAAWVEGSYGEGIFGWSVDDCKFGPYPLRGYTVVSHWMPLPEVPK